MTSLRVVATCASAALLCVLGSARGALAQPLVRTSPAVVQPIFSDLDSEDDGESDDGADIFDESAIEDPEPRARASAELAFHAGSDAEDRSVVAISPLLSASTPVAGATHARLRWGFASAIASAGRFTALDFRVGNPELSVWIGGRAGRVEPRIGVAVAMPLASMPDENSAVDPPEPETTVARIAFDYAEWMRGGAAPWLWRRDKLALVLPIELAVDVASGWAIESAIDLAVMLHLDPAKGETQSVMRLAVGPVRQLGGAGEVGLRAQVVAWPDELAADGAQISTEAWGRLDLGDDAHVGASLLVAIDGPFGLTSDYDVWSIGIDAGTAFE